MEAFDELNKIKNIYLNKQLSQIINEPQINFLKNPIVSENSNKKMKYLFNSNINHKFKRIFDASEEKEEKSGGK